MIQAVARADERAEELAVALLDKAGLSLPTEDGGGTTLADLRELYIKHLKLASSVGPASIAKYTNAMLALESVLGKDSSAERVTDADIVKFRDEMLQRPREWMQMEDWENAPESKRRLSHRTVGEHLQRVRTIYSWAIAERRLHRRDVPGQNVSIKSSSKQKKCPTPQQADALCKITAHKAWPQAVWYAVPMISRYTGATIQDISLLTPDDFRVIDGIRQINLRGSKTEHRTRWVPIADKLQPVIDEILSSSIPDHPIFDLGNQTTKVGEIKFGHAWVKIWNKAAKKVGQFSFHCLRLYANDQLATAGVDPHDRRRIMGHKVTDDVQSHYTSVNLQRWKKAVNAIT